MTVAVFDEVLNRVGTCSVKWDETKQIFGTNDCLPMWIADMEFKAPKVVLDAIEKRVQHGILGYTSIPESIKHTIQNWVKARQNWKLSSEWITFSNGIVPALATAIQALTNTGDKVVVQSPVYNPFYDMIEKNGREIVYNPLILKDGKFGIDFEDFYNKIDERVKLLLLCNPHNPGGRIWSRDELQKLGEICLEKNIIVVSDEIHSDLILPGKSFASFASLNDDFAERSITCIAPSKTFNIAGLQASAIIIPNEEIRERFTAFQQRQGFFSLNTFGIIAMDASYQHGEVWLQELLIYLQENIHYTENFLARYLPKLKIMKPDASFLLWIDCRKLGISEEDLREKLLYKGKIALECGSKYGHEGEGFVRMNIGCPRTTLKDGLNRLYTALKE